MKTKWLMILGIFFHLAEGEQDDMTCEEIETYKKEFDTDYHVRCQGKLSAESDFDSILANFSKPIYIFELSESLLDFLPENIFGGLENITVIKIVFTQSSFSMLSLPEYKETFFSSVENTLESMEIFNCSFAFAWNMSILSSLSNLKSFIIENSELITIENYFQDNLNLKFIQITKCKVKWLHDKVFKKNENLRICSLSNNEIKSLSRSMFPKPALHLWSLDLSYNRLKSLPEDMFEEMQFLKELKLDNNHLKINGKVFKRVWGGLTQLWINGNSVVCWELCSIVTISTKRPLFFNSSKCYLPPPRKNEILLDEFTCSGSNSFENRFRNI